MKLKSAIRIILWAVVAIVIVAGTVLIRNASREAIATASTVVRMKTVAAAPPPVTEPVSTPPPQTSEADVNAAASALANNPVPPPPFLTLEGNSDASAFALAAESEVAQLHDGITLTRWLRERGEREGWRKIPEEPVTSTSTPGPECLSYWRTAKLPSGAETTLAVYFYPPPAPSPAVFPTLSAQELINGCVLTVVRLEAAAVTSDFVPALERDARAQEFGNALDQAVRQRFTKLYGESIGRKDDAVWGRGSILLRNAARWIHGGEIISGYDPQGSPFGQLVSAPAVFVHAQLQMSGQAKHDHSETYGARSIPKSQFHRAVALAKADAALSRRFEDLYDQVSRSGSSEEEAKRPENAKWRESLLPLLREWLAALKTAPPAQRAAGLLASDRLVEAAQNVVGGVPGWPEKPEKTSELQKLGAVFEMNGIAGYYFYAGNWEKEARELDPDGPAGKMAVIGWMDRGSCDIAGWGSDLFNKVISDGEGLLAKGLDAPTTAQVHSMVGDAYSDIFSIAKGYDPNGDYPNIQERDAAPAHAKALEHYRAGLAIDNSSEDAKHAWSQAWHLSAGLLPTMRYVCFGD
jgi:hypothetical protein